MTRLKAIAILALTGASAGALWFPVRSGRFDPNIGILEYTDAWATNQRVGFLHGMGGTPVGPHWMITAGHLTSVKIFDYKQGAHGNGSYHLIETVPHPKYPRVDLRLYRTEETFPDYAPLAKTPSRSNAVLTAYGRGKSAPTIPVMADGRVIGWSEDRWQDGREGLRAGGITNHTFQSRGDVHVLKWYLDAGPATAWSDSGHPVFQGEALAGILTSAPSAVTFRFGRTGPCTNTAYLFDDSATSICSTNLPADTKAYTTALDLTSYLPWIYANISPPVRLAAAVTNEAWKTFEPKSARRYRARQELQLSGLTNAAPPEVYRTMFYRKGKPIEWVAKDLLRTGKYRVRLHFAGLRFARPGRVVQAVEVNGRRAAAAFDPFLPPGGRDQGSVIEVREVVPDNSNQVTIRLVPTGGSKYAAICGLEIVLEE